MCVVSSELVLIKDSHDDRSGSVSALVLRKIVAPGELLTAVRAFERLLTGVERTEVALQMFLTAEAARAEIADERLGRILSERLFATAAADWVGRDRSGRVV